MLSTTTTGGGSAPTSSNLSKPSPQKAPLQKPPSSKPPSQEGAPDPRDIAEQLVDLFVRNLAVAITYGPVADAIKAAWIKTRQEWRAK